MTQSTALARLQEHHRTPAHVDMPMALEPASFDQMQRLARLMSCSALVPASLREGGGDIALANCFLVVEQAARWGMSPFAVAQSVAVIHGKLCYEGKLVAAVLASKLGVRLRYEWNGKSGDAMGITVTGTLDGGDLTITGTVGEWKTTGQGSPWKPSQYQKMLAYRGAREWARLYAPEVMLGVYTPDEMMTAEPRELRDITPKLQAAPADEPLDNPAGYIVRLEDSMLNTDETELAEVWDAHKQIAHRLPKEQQGQAEALYIENSKRIAKAKANGAGQAQLNV